MMTEGYYVFDAEEMPWSTSSVGAPVGFSSAAAVRTAIATVVRSNPQLADVPENDPSFTGVVENILSQIDDLEETYSRMAEKVLELQSSSVDGGLHAFDVESHNFSEGLPTMVMRFDPFGEATSLGTRLDDIGERHGFFVP